MHAFHFSPKGLGQATHPAQHPLDDARAAAALRPAAEALTTTTETTTTWSAAAATGAAHQGASQQTSRYEHDDLTQVRACFFYAGIGMLLSCR